MSRSPLLLAVGGCWASLSAIVFRTSVWTRSCRPSSQMSCAPDTPVSALPSCEFPPRSGVDIVDLSNLVSLPPWYSTDASLTHIRPLTVVLDNSACDRTITHVASAHTAARIIPHVALCIRFTRLACITCLLALGPLTWVNVYHINPHSI